MSFGQIWLLCFRRLALAEACDPECHGTGSATGQRNNFAADARVGYPELRAGTWNLGWQQLDVEALRPIHRHTLAPASWAPLPAARRIGFAFQLDSFSTQVAAWDGLRGFHVCRYWPWRVMS